MKIGRNDSCPCGSGKKYKHCCGGNIIPFIPADTNSKTHSIPENVKQQMLAGAGASSEAEFESKLKQYEKYCESLPEGADIPTFMQYQGRPGIATETIQELTADLKKQVFTSTEDLERFISQRAEEQNHARLNSFLGLSPAQMHNILQQPFSQNNNLVTIKDNPENDLTTETPVIRYSLYILRSAESNPEGIRATQTGCFNRKTVQEFHGRFAAAARLPDSIPNREAEEPVLEKMRILLTACRFIRKKQGHFILTKKARKVIETGTTTGLYIELIKYYLEKHNWLYLTRFPEIFDFIQRAGLFLLYELKVKGTDYISQQQFTAVFMDAFPQLKQEIVEYFPYFRDDFAVAFLFLENFCNLFGLTEEREQPSREKTFITKKDYRNSGLFDCLFDWKI